MFYVKSHSNAAFYFSANKFYYSFLFCCLTKGPVLKMLQNSRTYMIALCSLDEEMPGLFSLILGDSWIVRNHVLQMRECSRKHNCGLNMFVNASELFILASQKARAPLSQLNLNFTSKWTPRVLEVVAVPINAESQHCILITTGRCKGIQVYAAHPLIKWDYLVRLVQCVILPPDTAAKGVYRFTGRFCMTLWSTNASTHSCVCSGYLTNTAHEDGCGVLFPCTLAPGAFNVIIAEVPLFEWITERRMHYLGTTCLCIYLRN